METKQIKKKPNVIDILIAILLILCVVGIGLRFMLVEATPDPDTLPDVETEKYYVSYIVRNMRHSYVNYVAEGEEFRFYYTNKPFGVSCGTSDIKNALKRYVTSDGQDVTVYNMAEDDMVARYDIWGSFLVEGKLTEDGNLIINESASETLGLNSDVYIRSDKTFLRIYITDITPAE